MMILSKDQQSSAKNNKRWSVLLYNEKNAGWNDYKWTCHTTNYSSCGTCAKTYSGCTQSYTNGSC